MARGGILCVGGPALSHVTQTYQALRFPTELERWVNIDSDSTQRAHDELRLHSDYLVLKFDRNRPIS